jgi:Arc/MetJ-type ribon-helix-helix transcriptional regulator
MARHPERDKLRKQAVSITLDAKDITFIEQGIHHRMFQNRSHAVAWALQLLRVHVANIMRVQQEEAARRGTQGGSVFPPPNQTQPGDSLGFPPR